MHHFIQFFCLTIISVELDGVLSIVCEAYNQTLCKLGEKCKSVEYCQESPCYTSWSNNTDGTINVKFKGCWKLKEGNCVGQTTCVHRGAAISKNVLFCCCKADLCNEKFHWMPTPTPPSPIQQRTVLVPPSPEDTLTWISFLVLMVVLLVVLGFLMYMLKNRKIFFFTRYILKKVPLVDQHVQSASSADLQKLLSVSLIEIKAGGKFGTVWKAILDGSETVAVKKLAIQEKHSWSTEQEVYKLPLMGHENILRFIAAEKHDDTFWLITAYHELGSLHDFLKANTVTWEQLCHIAYTISRGLMHLHEEIPSDRSEFYKPAIAHRDFKSSNVLLKSDFTACIADFGLALVFSHSRLCGDTREQVGTRRYMAPEILEGAINFSRDAFVRIDMYACGLVLWELASRCSLQSGPVAEYKLPFEEELVNQRGIKKQYPTFSDIQEVVVHKKKRPLIKKSWRDHQGFSVLCETIEECWDHDAEARLSASCVMERISLYAKPVSSANTSLLFNDKKILNNNVNMNLTATMGANSHQKLGG